MIDKNNEVKSDVIAGRNPVSEAIRSNRPIDKILVARGEKSGAVVCILAKAKDKQIPIKEVDKTKLDCDYFKFLDYDVDAVNSYKGEYTAFNHRQCRWFSLRNKECLHKKCSAT